MSTTQTIEQLQARLATLADDIDQRQREIDRLIRERDALQLALTSLQEIQDDVLNQSIGDGGGEDFTYRQSIVVKNVPFGENNAMAPYVISSKCTGLEKDYVRKTLRRLSEYGKIEVKDGKYWREQAL